MASSGPSPDQALSTSVSTNTSQASTKIPGSDASTTQLRERLGQVTEQYNGGNLAQGEFSTTKSAATEKAAYEISDADGLRYSQPGPAWTESTDVPREHLGFLQVFAFMINQSIGSGIFYTPGYVMLLTRSKSVSVALWLVGGVYSLLSACVFLEFSTALPYNGGALIYLDEAFPKPRMLAATIFSWFWILLCSVEANCVTSAVYILELVYPEKEYGDIDPRSAQFLGIVVNSVACLLLYFLLRGCLLLNSVFAAFRVVLLIVFFVAGIVHACKSGSGLDDFNEEKPGANAIDSIAAMTYIVGTYEGWENTNYIAGEIRTSRRTLKWAAFTALTTLTILYVLVTVAYLAVLRYEDIADSAADISVQFAEAVFGGGTATKAAITLSAFTNVIVSTYTAAKVKQAIAWQRIIPFYKFFGRQDRQFDSPGGALVLHWIFTTLRIAVLRPTGDAWEFQTGLFSYGYEIMLFFIGIGIFFLPRRMKLVDPDWKPVYMKTLPTQVILVAVFVGMSLLLLYSIAQPDDDGTVPRYYWPVTLGAIMGAAALYWAALKALQMRWGGEDTLGRRVGFEVSVHEAGDEVPTELDAMMKEAIADGGRRRLTYKISGRLATTVRKGKAAWKVIVRCLG